MLKLQNRYILSSDRPKTPQKVHFTTDSKSLNKSDDSSSEKYPTAENISQNNIKSSDYDTKIIWISYENFMSFFVRSAMIVKNHSKIDNS